MNRPARPAAVSSEEARGVITKTIEAARKLDGKPGLSAAELTRLRWALRHRTQQIDAVLRDAFVVAEGADLEAHRAHFIQFMEDAMRAVASRSLRLRKRMNAPAKPKPTSPNEAKAEKAAVKLHSALAAMSANERKDFFWCLDTSFRAPEETPKSAAMAFLDALPPAMARFVFERVLERATAHARERPERRVRLAGTTNAFVDVAARYWESPLVGRSVNGGRKPGSLRDFCEEVNKRFELGFAPNGIATAITELAKKRSVAAENASAKRA